MRTSRFGFAITGSSRLVAVVKACTHLAHPIWSPVGTNTLTGGSSYFSDPQCRNCAPLVYGASEEVCFGSPKTRVVSDRAEALSRTPPHPRFLGSRFLAGFPEWPLGVRG